MTSRPSYTSFFFILCRFFFFFFFFFFVVFFFQKFIFDLYLSCTVSRPDLILLAGKISAVTCFALLFIFYSVGLLYLFAICPGLVNYQRRYYNLCKGYERMM